MDTLLTIAEIAVAFAGFASIANAISRRYSGLNPKVNSLRLHNMVDIALTAVVLCFMPVLTSEVFESEELLWMSASFLSLIFGAFTFYRVTNRAKPMVNLEGYDRKGSLRIRMIGSTALVGLVIGSTGLLSDYAYAVYLSSVLLILLASGILFFRVIESLVYQMPENDDSLPGKAQENGLYARSQSDLSDNDT